MPWAEKRPVNEMLDAKREHEPPCENAEDDAAGVERPDYELRVEERKHPRHHPPKNIHPGNGGGCCCHRKSEAPDQHFQVHEPTS